MSCSQGLCVTCFSLVVILVILLLSSVWRYSEARPQNMVHAMLQNNLVERWPRSTESSHTRIACISRHKSHCRRARKVSITSSAHAVEKWQPSSKSTSIKIRGRKAGSASSLSGKDVRACMHVPHALYEMSVHSSYTWQVSLFLRF